MSPAPTAPEFSAAIAIATFRRAELLSALLAEVSRQIGETERRIPHLNSSTVLVIDNDPQASARETVEALALPRVSYLHEPVAGIAAARNRALDEAGENRLLVFVDDDEMPCAGWLSSLIETWSQTQAAAVSGCVEPKYETTPSGWILAGEFFVRRREPTGTSRMAAPAGNLLLDLWQVRAAGVRFEEPFGLTGGEDTLLTRRMSARGLRIVWCSESVVTDLVPSARARPRWVLRRAFSHGNTSSLVERQLAVDDGRRGATRVRLVGGGLARLGLGLVRAVVGTVCRSARQQSRGLRLTCRGAGMVAGAVGIVFQEYARPSTPGTVLGRGR